MEQIEFKSDGASIWAGGFCDYLLISPDKRHEVTLRYLREPPHGDCYSEAYIDGVRLPGFAWGSNFAFTADSNFFAASWMLQLYERHTIIVDIGRRRYYMLPEYIYDFSLCWPTVLGVGSDEGRHYGFDGSEVWTPF